MLPLAYFYLFEPKVQKASEGWQSAENHGEINYPRFLVNFIYLVTFLSMLLFYMGPVQIPFLLKELGVERNSLTGFAIVVGTFMGAITSFNYRRVKARLSYIQIYALSFALMGVGFYFVGVARSYATVLAGMAVGGLGMGFLMPNPSLWLMSLAPAKIRGRLIGGLTMAVFLGQFFSPIASEPVVKQWSLSIAFGAAGIIMFSMAIAFLLSNQYMMNRDRQWRQIAETTTLRFK